MTLDDLHANLVAAFEDPDIAEYVDDFVEVVFEGSERSDILDGVEAVQSRYRAAKLYVIARDEGMDAAMLWKLANG